MSPGVVCGVGGVHGAVAPARVHLELPVLALLGDGVHLREEYRADEDPACTTITVKPAIIIFTIKHIQYIQERSAIMISLIELRTDWQIGLQSWPSTKCKNNSVPAVGAFEMILLDSVSVS